MVSCKSQKVAGATAAKTGTTGDPTSKKFQAHYFEALKYKALGNDEQALGNFEKCLKLVPDHAPSLYEKARILERMGAVEEALVAAERSVKNDPENRWYSDYLAGLYERTGRYAEAAELYDKLWHAYRGYPEYPYRLANMYLYANELEKAIRVYDTLENDLGFDEGVITQKYKIYVQLKRIPEARAEVEKLVAYNPEEVKYYNMLANLYKEEGKLEDAIRTIEQLLERFPDDPLVYLTLADYHREAGNREASFEALKSAFRSPDMDIDNKISILLNYYQTSAGNPKATEEAYALLDITAETHPEEAKAFAMYGDFLVRDEKRERALEKYQRAIELDDSRFLVWNQLLFLEYELGDTVQLQKDSQRAIELFPNQPIVYFFNGLTHLQQESYDQAILSLEQGQGLVVDNPQLQFQFFANLADAYYQSGKYQQAWMNYDRALRIDPSSDYILNNYAYFLSLRKEDLDKAKKMAFECVKRNPDDPTYLDTYGWVLYQMGDYRNARIYLERAIENGGDAHGEVLEHYGDVLYELGETEKAVEIWKQARDKGGASENIDAKIENKSLVK